jgi:uncharacterized membrane protein
VKRSLVVVAVGWVAGFLIATALSSTHTGNPGLAGRLWPLAVAGMAVIALLLLAGALSGRAERRRSAGEARAAAESAAREVTEVERRSAARIAELETSLARELEKLDSAVASLAATQLQATERASAGTVAAVPDTTACELEPVLRREVVEAVAELVENAGPGETAALAGHLEALLGKAR